MEKQDLKGYLDVFILFFNQNINSSSSMRNYLRNYVLNIPRSPMKPYLVISYNTPSIHSSYNPIFGFFLSTCSEIRPRKQNN